MEGSSSGISSRSGRAACSRSSYPGFKTRGSTQCSRLVKVEREQAALPDLETFHGPSYLQVNTSQSPTIDLHNNSQLLDLFLSYSSSDRNFSSTEKSSSVVVSPATEPLVAISRRRRRMIFPDRVLGKASEKRISSGRASAPISLAT